MKKRLFFALTMVSVIFSLVLGMTMVAFAAETEVQPAGRFYELQEGSEYSIVGQNPVKRFTYGKDSVGEMGISGVINAETIYNGVVAYSVTDPVLFTYEYGGKYQNDNKDVWNFCSDNEKSVNGIELEKKIKSGVIIIQKSTNRVEWEMATEPVYDFFSENKSGSNEIYEAPVDDLKTGMYYRVTVAYKMARRTTDKNVLWVIPADEYEYKEFVEIYEYYMASAKNHVTVHDLVKRGELKNAATTNDGFYIQKNGSTATVTVKKDGLTTTVADEYDYFTRPGNYTIVVKTPLGKTYTHSISISGGLALSSLHPTVYESDKNDGFPEENPIRGKTTFGQTALTTLSIARTAGSSMSTSEVRGFDAYGLTGQNVSLFLKLNCHGDDLGNGWEIAADKWGKKEKEQVGGVSTGEIGKGALIIQTSKNGTNWTAVDMGRYAKGLYTTDFASHYATDENVLIYTPAGKDVLNGVYVRVLFAYQAFNAEEKEYADYLEKYEFYLCSDELNAVTFHNLSAKKELEAHFGDEDEETVALYQSAETLLSGSYTTTGFEIDTTNNPTVTYTVEKDGKSIVRQAKYTESGRYNIHLTSKVGNKRDVTIYVDTNNAEQAMEFYFGEGFLDGKRIYDESKPYPVYEGGLTEYLIASVPNSHPPISGTIINQTTGSTIEIASTRTAKTGTITEPGEYIAEFKTPADGELPGDTRLITFRFYIIAEGAAPGPAKNQEMLAEYAMKTVSDAYPMFYGVTHPSASTGYITRAFASREAAKEYAYQYEKGMVEKQDDGSFRYTGSLYVKEKEKIDSAWDLTDAAYQFAEEAVHERFFNLSDKYSYLTLSEDIIHRTNNLRTLELDRSVTIFADDQKQELCATGCLPIISRKPYSFLSPGESGKVTDGFYDFEFISDKYKCDSAEVVIVDSNGQKYPIQYGKGVGKQLQDAGCPSGVVTISEKTIYGDEATYEAVFIRDGENTGKLTLTTYTDGKQENVAFSQSDDGVHLTVDAFKLSSVIDELDPCTLVSISNATREYFYVAGRIATDAWAEPGDYVVKVINRLGFTYSINVTVNDAGYATVEFNGNGTEDIQTIVTAFGERNVDLPEITRYGYDLVGFRDEGNSIYTDKLSEITFKGTRVFEPVWKAKTVKVAFHDSNGNELLPAVVAEFDGTIPLPVDSFKDQEGFAGWSMNGTLVSGPVLPIETEDDIILVAISDNTGDDSLAVSEANNDGGSVYIVLVIGVILLVAVFTWSNIRKKKMALGSNDEQVAEDGDGIDEK